MKNNCTNRIKMLVAIWLLPLTAQCQDGLFFCDKALSPGISRPLEIKAWASIKPHFQHWNEFDDLLLIPNLSSPVVNPSGDIAFSPFNHLVLGASYRWLISHSAVQNASLDWFEMGGVHNNSYSGERYELSAGYYTKFGKKLLLEALGGYMHGNMKRDADLIAGYNSNYYNYSGTAIIPVDISSSGIYNGFFLQAATGIETKHMALRGGMKFTGQHYSRFTYVDDNAKDVLPAEQQPEHITATTNTYGQIFADFEAGGEHIRFNTQVGGATTLYSSTDNALFYMSFGLVVRITPKAGHR